MELLQINPRIEPGLRWAAVRQVVNGLTGTLGVLAYTRMLRPEDLGAFGLALVVYQGLLSLIEAPMRDAVVYFRDEQGQHDSAAFWILLAFSSLAVILVWTLSPGLIRLYRFEVDASLVWVMGLAFFGRAMGLVPGALLLKRFQFAWYEGLLMLADMILFVGWVTLAWRGLGAWSLVLPVLFSTVCLSAAAWWASGFRPQRWPAASAFRDVLRFTRNLFGSKLASYLCGYIDNAAAGLMGARALGLYSLGEDQSAFAVISVGVPLANIALPVLANARARMEEFKRIYLNMLRLTATLTLPMQIGVFLLADLGIKVLFGEQWLEAAPVLRAYLVFRLVDALLTQCSAATSAAGRPDIQFKLDVAQAPFFLLVAWAALSRGVGIIGLAWMLACMRSLAGLVYLAVTLRLAGANLAEAGRSLGPSLLSGVLMGAAVFGLRGSGMVQGWVRGVQPALLADGLELTLLVASGAVTYLLILWIVDRAGLKDVLRLAWRVLVPSKAPRLPITGKIS
ncbi:MAG: oligosaccharide flippase family protein [Chloroflexota bacterium]